MTRGDLKQILEAGDLEACLAYFEHATEAERKAVAAQAFEWHKVQKANWLIANTATTFRTNPLLEAADIAVRAACSFSQLKERGLNLTDRDFGVMEARRPTWLSEYAAWSLERVPQIWPAVRRLERAGLCRRPDTDHYVLGMINGVAPRHAKPNLRDALLRDRELLEREVWRLFEVEGSGEFSLAAHDKYAGTEGTWEGALTALAADGTLARDRLLDASLDALERDFAQFRAGWFSRFHEALKPTLDERAERVERYLNLLASKIPPTVSFALSALSKLDRAQRLPGGKLVEHIGPALGARSKGAVSSALKLLGNAAGHDPAVKQRAAMLAAQALTHESPEAQSEAFDLVIRCGDRADGALVALIRDQLGQLAASAQARVREWLGSAAAPSAAEPFASMTAPLEAELDELIARASGIAPEFRKLAGVDAAVAAIRAGHCDLPALEFDGTEFPRLDPAAQIQPISSQDELIDVLSAVLENPDATDDVERVLDGLSRLCGDRASDFHARTGPLRKRATALLERGSSGDQYGPFSGWNPALDLCALALSWTTGEAIDPDAAPRFNNRFGKVQIPMLDYGTRIGKWSGTARVIEQSAEMLFLSRRALAVARRAATGQAELLLSAPTHRGGWIDPIVLADRIEAQAHTAITPDAYDQVQAILRLAPERRAEAGRRLQKVKGEFAQAVRYALGGDTRAIGSSPALWVAAARARAPFDDDPFVLARYPSLGPDAGTAAKFVYRVRLESNFNRKKWARFLLNCQPPVPPDVQAEFPTVRLHSLRTERDSATIRWAATIWPLAREAWLAQGVDVIGINLDWWEASWSDRTYLEPLTDPDLPMKPMALVLLTLGLAAKQPDESGLATDGLIAAIDDGRIDGPLLGGAMRSLLLTTLIKLSRWAKTLREAARTSPLHARVVAHAVQHALGDNLVEPPRDILALLELLRELLIEIGEPVSLTPMRAWLTGWKASGKTAQVVKNLLALTENSHAPGRRDAALRALARRIDRAERWSRNAR